MKFSCLAFLLLIVTSAWAQPNPWFYQPLGQVRQFLQLTDSQLQRILTNNDEYNRWSAEKQTRIWQVQSEIADETARDSLDPMALGIRYAEIESICRETRNQATAYQKKNTDILTDPQKARLKLLEDAMKLAPVISEAQGGNLIGEFTYAPPFFTNASGSTISSGMIGGIIGPATGCSLPFPNVVRNPFPAGVVRARDSTSPRNRTTITTP